MDQPSQPDPRHALESQIRECFGRCAYTHKTHEKMAERHAVRMWRAKWAQILISALTTAGAVGVIFAKDTAFFAYATASLSILGLIFNSYVKDLDPGALAQRHREAASDIWNIREAYLSLITDITDESFAVDKLRARREELQAALHKIYRAAAFTDDKAYALAQGDLKNKEALTFSEEEIDLLLPETLRRGKRGLLSAPPGPTG